MNPITTDQPVSTQLKIIVERAVRPVEAGTTRKQRMREELLAHVTAVFEEEAAAPGDEGRALQRTRERFGDPAALTAQLQQSVPAFERWTRGVEVAFMARGLSAFQLAWRGALLSLLFPGAAFILVFAAQGRLAEWPLTLACAAVVFGFILLLHAMRDALFGPRGRSWPRAALISFAAWLFIPSITLALCFAFSGNWRTSLEDVVQLLPFSLLTPVVLILPAWGIAIDARTQQEWTCLRID